MEARRPRRPWQSAEHSDGGPNRRAVLASGALSVATIAAVAACTNDTTSRQGGSSASKGSPSPTAAPHEAAIQDLPTLNDKVEGFTMADMSKIESPIDVQFPVPGPARGLVEGIDIAVNKILREHSYLQDKGTLSIRGKIFASAASVLGAILTGTVGKDTAPSVVWYDASRDRAVTSPALILPEKWGEFSKAVQTAGAKVKNLDTQGLDTFLQEQPRPFGNGPAIMFSRKGELQLLFPAAKVDNTQGPQLVTMDAATAEPFLSPFGRAAKAAVMTPAAFDKNSIKRPDGSGNKRYDGDALYEQVTNLPEPQKARAADPGPGPVSQLAPRSGPGVRPATVCAPDGSRLKAICMSFDDGPSPELNGELLTTLRTNKAAASFFNIGRSSHAAPKYSADTAAAGQELGCHSWSHPPLTKVAQGPKLDQQIIGVTDELAKHMGRRPLTMRPPYGAHNHLVDDSVGAQSQSVQLWYVDTEDWKYRNVQHNIDSVKKNARRGAIVLMHEIHPTSVKAVPQILKNLEAEGYTTMTCSEIGQNQMYAGKWYTRGFDFTR
ncbi:polysaccharide deacetylase family protein [Devriesea agamarum]|uniref:polysaccharide deacetylase family protein n=1 Tax=Devriesea agamarum TaxID=472569 RepID=UPI00071DFB05|nr:polysaccharide deacetylase family protein [Devriesea agamarum]